MPRRLRNTSTPASPRNARSTRKRASRAAEKSKYFEPPTDDEKDSFENEEESSPGSASDTSETDFDEPARKKSKVTPKKAVSPKTAKKSQPKRKKKGEEEEEPWETFIPKEATPEAGNVEYRDDGIHPNTLQFLKGGIFSCGRVDECVDLVKNNDREWFWSHEVPIVSFLQINWGEKRYRAAEKDFKT